MVQQKLADLLNDVERRTRSRLIAVSSIGIGADIIFVEACLAKDWPWIAILPIAPSEFFNRKDFPDEKVRAHAMSLLETASSVEITNPNGGEKFLDPAYRAIAFSDSGARIVDCCDVFLAVLRQTNDPPKPGGTLEIVTCAKRCERPIGIIHPDDGHIEYHHWPALFEPGFLAKIGSLPETPLRDEFLTAHSGPELRTVVDWFSHLSAAARRSVPRLRSVSSIAVILHGCAVLLALALITVPWVFYDHRNIHFAEWIKVIIAGGAFAATIWFLVGRPHARAARYRLRAEICRSLIATWEMPEAHRQIFRGFPSEYRDFIRMLLNLRRLEGPSLTQQQHATVGSEQLWKRFSSDYLATRIKKQVIYYTTEHQKARWRLTVLEPLSWLCSAGGLLLVTCLAIASSSGRPISSQPEGIPEFGTIAFPALAGILVALLAVKEATRRKGRYGEMLGVLKENAERLKYATHKDLAFEIVIDNERALLAENVEWANTAKYPAAG